MLVNVFLPVFASKNLFFCEVFNSCKAIAEAFVGRLLVFTTRRGVLVLLRFFLQEVLFVQRAF